MTHFLTTDDNPQGFKLEDILTMIRQDVIHRMEKIMTDHRSEAQQVLKNNVRILALLTESIEIAEGSTVLLKRAFGPSVPEHPRIGVR